MSAWRLDRATLEVMDTESYDDRDDEFAPPPVRVGHGYDLHRLEPPPPEGKGRSLIVGGVTLVHPLGYGSVAHSDGDVLYHAVTDALLGALALPDIGELFPDDASANESRDSAEFVRAAMEHVRHGGYRVGNLDATVILERPRLSPMKEQIRSNLEDLLRIPTMAQGVGGVVNVKGKSHERVDAVGRDGRSRRMLWLCLCACE